jgi:hypothetical protein
MKLRGGIFAVLSLVLLLAPTSHAEDKSGLYISPIRKELSVDAGKSNSSFVTIGNHTKSPMTVKLSVKQFTVSEYTYDYSFLKPVEDWIKLTNNQITLKPSENKEIIYDVEAPRNAAPGGYYYTVVASADIKSGGVLTTIQTTSLLYITVNGNLVRTSVLKNSSIPWFITGTQIPFKFDVLDTGNVHFQAYFYGQLQSIFGNLPEVGSNNLVFPGKVRAIQGTIPAPFWPGIYRAVYGYKVDFADIDTSQSSYVLYLPPWSIVALVVIALVIIWSVQLSRPRKKSAED